MVFSQTEILQKEVFLVDKLAKHNRDKMPHMKAVVFVRPTQGNVQNLVDELRDPKYGEYHICAPRSPLSHRNEADCFSAMQTLPTSCGWSTLSSSRRPITRAW